MNSNELYEKADQTRELSKAMEAGKSAEVKQMEALLKVTKDEIVADVLETKIAELDKPAMSLVEAQEEIESLGYTMHYIIKLGLSKLSNQLGYQAKEAAKKENKSFDVDE